jgi:hypothetical protein
MSRRIAPVHPYASSSKTGSGKEPQGRTLLDLAEVLELAHRDDEAAQLVETALDLFEQKGNVVVAEKTRVLLARLRV